MNRSVISVLRVLLALVFLLLLLGQVIVIPSLVAESAIAFPEVVFLAAPYTFISISAIACVQLAVLATWVLLSRVEQDSIFSERALGWVNTIIASIVTATILLVFAGLHMLVVVQAGGPGIFLATCAAGIGGAATVLLIIVMRGLLRNATTLESEMAEVV
ncbi:hypothetical protein CQ018_17770 [Arthrobacter sp. MYb227]|uniref:DUF2975 domain-containing protein n=1 Tax=Arthrobacter sp. MYb227 TaxID=1848601 RepID=UPI000CFB60F8|nr:DUF2975 domain-containing protein [Arthrobacter sp. MYb227]PQZ87309.1 hypothetical protein CQ018_17770 [Arthrobacter sp. MYb227]